MFMRHLFIDNDQNQDYKKWFRNIFLNKDDIEKLKHGGIY